MGHGCNHKNPEYNTPIAWIDMPYNDDEIGNDIMLHDTVLEIQEIALKLFPSHIAPFDTFTDISRFWHKDYREWHILTQSSGSSVCYSHGHNDELLIAVLPRWQDVEYWPDTAYKANCDRHYDAMQYKLYQKLKRSGYSLRKASSAWTSCAV